MVSFVQDIGGGNKLVWDLDKIKDSDTIGDAKWPFLIIMIIFMIALVLSFS